MQVKIISDSMSTHGKRITTMQLKYQRFIHAEFMTHRCLVGDSMLIFDLPSGKGSSKFRKYEMSIEEFYNKWVYGGKERKPSRFVSFDTSNIVEDKLYSAKELALIVGMKTPSNIRTACREGKILVQNPNKVKADDYLILGKDFINYRTTPKNYKQNIKDRLKSMSIRMLDTDSGEVKHTNITDIWHVGEKETYTLYAGEYSVTGTYDHPLLTDKGWKNLSDITTEDSIVVVSNKQNIKKDPTRLKYINGVWRNKWQKDMLKKLDEIQKGICSECGSKSKLEIHHIKPVYLNPELTFDESNIIAICNACHKKEHKKQGWQAGNPLSASFVKVTSVQKTGKIEKVYDLSVADKNHNFVVNNIVVHNCFSRNASSSRAIPVAKMIEQVRNDPAMPVHWGKNQPGMQAKDVLTEPEEHLAKNLWFEAAVQAADTAERMNKLGLHKQVTNRILEPFQWIHVVVTSTEWDNFFELRYHEDAQPEIYELAKLMWRDMQESTPRLLLQGDWHLPYVTEEEYINLDIEVAKKVSAARCCRVSYLKHDGTNSTIEEDLDLCKKLAGARPIHASPFEHQATPDLLEVQPRGSIAGWKNENLHGNFVGWIQHRKLIEKSFS